MYDFEEQICLNVHPSESDEQISIHLFLLVSKLVDIRIKAIKTYMRSSLFIKSDILLWQ